MIENDCVFDFVAIWIDVSEVRAAKDSDELSRLDQKSRFLTDLAANSLFRTLAGFNGARRQTPPFPRSFLLKQDAIFRVPNDSRNAGQQ
jgi:hypothetical protein